MGKRWFWMAIAMGLALSSCKHAAPVASGAAGGEAVAVAPAGKVEVAADGSNFDPPVKKDQIPAGAWICDMGTVHYARMTEGDGTCPRCKMKLVHHAGH